VSTTTRTGRKRRSDGERSRRAILDAAGQLATVEGLEGITIGRLADHIGMSKSGLYAHFGSKEELQLATVGAAEEVFDAEVVRPAEAAEHGLPRLDALCEGFLSHVERSVFPGGCFFASAAAEFDTRPGRVRDRVAGYLGSWAGRLRAEVDEAQRRGELDPADDPAQVVFEIQSALLLANTLWVLAPDPAVMRRARAQITDRIARSRPR
jgi:AcrR family transcriptional regulator